jgi:hypothetical protein
MRIPAFLCLVALAACGSTVASSGQGDQTIGLDAAGGSNMRLLASDGPHVEAVKGSREEVFRMLPAIYDTLGIKVTDLNPEQYFIGNSAFKVRRMMGNVMLTRYLDCGSAQGFPSAETYDIQMSIRTTVTASPSGGSSLATLVEAVGRPVAFAGEYVRCSTKGALEKAIADAVKARAH